MGTALVTGASSGLGLEFAWQLAAARHNLVLVARRAPELEEIAEDLRQAAGVRVEVLPADLARHEGLDIVAERLRSGEAPVGLLVNNAGFGLGQGFVGGDLAREEEALAVLVRAVLVLSHAAAPAMVARGHGAILNVSSVAAHTAMGTYAAHKAWVRSFTESLASELRTTPVTATALMPGLVRTGFHAASGMNADVWPAFGWLRAEDVVSAALAAVRHGDVLCTPSLMYKSANAFLRHAPRWLVRSTTGPGLSARAIL
ncbi:MAG: SDR family NAD(P)-dependent oxidoreductase [Actinomycetota bacterium]